MSPSTAAALSAASGVVEILPEQACHLDTTRSPQFLGLKSSNSSDLLTETDFGSDLVIGVIDTGIWPERRSFSDSGLL
ncbi:hypothetical protein KFK09_020570 [Dendrobium nobile]|uniref:Uncharacterized protein n=1 Tax=Dendrobium nobile TaxID=94219 RepID=A0A8T3AM79_DENNO|nr:hypothetical protein KFK09_020570 [Dendrobium nobile]